MQLLPRALAALALWCAAFDASAEEDAADLHPKYALVNGDIETVWQRPHGNPTGVFFIAHGCRHQGPDIFSDVGHDGWRLEACASTKLGRCLGLPEEVRLRQAARERGYVVMAVSGGSGEQRCWARNRDAERVVAAVKYVKKAEGLSKSAPVLASGASSGGAFLGTLAAPGGLKHLSCIIPQVMGLGGARILNVPTMFVRMSKDEWTADEVAVDLERLRKEGVRTAEILVNPVPVTAELLGRCLAVDVATEAAEALQKQKVLDDEGFQVRNPRSKTWVEPMRKVLAGRSDDNLILDQSCVFELLNVAWAFHEFTSEYAQEMLDFCEEKGNYSNERGHDL